MSKLFAITSRLLIQENAIEAANYLAEHGESTISGLNIGDIRNPGSLRLPKDWCLLMMGTTKELTAEINQLLSKNVKDIQPGQLTLLMAGARVSEQPFNDTATLVVIQDVDMKGQKYIPFTNWNTGALHDSSFTLSTVTEFLEKADKLDGRYYFKWTRPKPES